MHRLAGLHQGLFVGAVLCRQICGNKIRVAFAQNILRAAGSELLRAGHVQHGKPALGVLDENDIRQVVNECPQQQTFM